MFFPLPLVIQGNLALERAKQRYDTYPACTGTSPFCFLLWKFSILCILIFTSRPWGNCQNVIGNSISFATGLATTLALLGVAASFAGKAYGQIGRGLPVRSLGGVQAYLAGLTFVLAEDASPAVLQCLLRCLGMSRLHQGSTGRGSLLLTYTTGYVARLLLAASFAGSLQPAFILQVLSMDQSNEMIGLIKPTSGSAYVEGLDIWTEMNRIYTSMGVCPQHDFPWGILTGREHLLFYGRLKNLKGSSSVQTNKRGNIAEA